MRIYLRRGERKIWRQRRSWKKAKINKVTCDGGGESETLWDREEKTTERGSGAYIYEIYHPTGKVQLLDQKEHCLTRERVRGLFGLQEYGFEQSTVPLLITDKYCSR